MGDTHPTRDELIGAAPTHRCALAHYARMDEDAPQCTVCGGTMVALPSEERFRLGLCEWSRSEKSREQREAGAKECARMRVRARDRKAHSEELLRIGRCIAEGKPVYPDSPNARSAKGLRSV